MAHQLFQLPKQLNVSSNLTLLAGAKAYFYETTTTTPQDTFTTAALDVAHTYPVEADAAGVFPAIYLNPALQYKLTLKTSAGVELYTEDPINDQLLSQAIIGALLYPRTAAEIAAAITPTDYAYSPKPLIDVRRYGLVANSAGARAANTAALMSLVDPTVTGPIGNLIFPNVGGNDVYYFDVVPIELRRGIFADLDFSVLDFAGSYDADNDTYGFLNFIGDVTLKNGTINVDYDGSAGTNNGSAMRIGSRQGYPFGSFTGGIEDEDLTRPQGRIVLSSLDIVTNNPTHAILMLGGLIGVKARNLFLDGQSAATRGVYYEFGDWHYEATVANRKSSHAHNMTFENVHIKDLDTTTGLGFSLVGAYATSVRGLTVDGANVGLTARNGEALFYNVGDPYLAHKNRCITAENIVCKNITGTGMALQGAESKSGGYLSGEAGVTEDKQVDLLSFDVNGFSIEADGFGIFCSGPLTLKNGSAHGGASSGQLVLTDECVQFDIDNVRLTGSSNVGLRASFGSNIYASARLKMGSLRNSVIAGNTGAGTSWGNTRSVLIENNRFGYNTGYDGQAESTQTNAVNGASTATGLVCRGNMVSVASGVAYALSGTGERGCSIENARGARTSSGNWKIDGVSRDTATNIADVGAVINTDDKYAGKRVQDTSNNRLMVARGSAAADPWDIADGSASVTPS